MKDLANRDFAPYGIYPLSYMIEHSDKLDYAEIYRPAVEHIFQEADKSLQTQVILLRNLSTFAKFAPPDEIQQLLVPILENALQSHNPEILVSLHGKEVNFTRPNILPVTCFASDRKPVCCVSASFTQ